MVALGATHALADPDQEEPAATQAEGQSLYYDVTLNTWPLKLVAQFHQAGSRLWMSPEEFGEIGLAVEEAFVTTEAGERRVYLDQVPGLEWKVDEHAQTIAITAPAVRLKVQPLIISAPPPRVASRSDWGAMVSYDAFAQWSLHSDDPFFGRSLSSNLEGRVFSPFFTARTTAVVNVSAGAQATATRLESYVDFDDPDHIRRLRLGDSYAESASWMQNFRYGGVQWGTELSLRPDVITMPIPRLAQNLATPSTIDVFVNGVQRYAQAADPGAFRLTDLPVVTGANAVRVTITDQAGRRIQTVLPFYTSPDLLAAGTSQFNIAAGAARQNYAQESNDYEGLFATGRLARGVTDSLTLEGDLGTAKDFVNAAASANLSVFNAFLLFGAASVSHGPAGDGYAWWIGAERNAQKLSLSARFMRATEAYRDLPALFGYSRNLQEIIVSGGLNLGRGGQLSLAYTEQRPAGFKETQTVVANYQINLFGSRATFGVSSYYDVPAHNWGANLTLNVALGAHVRGLVESTRGSDSSRDSVSLRGDGFDDRLDWTVEAVRGDVTGGYAEANWEGRRADLYGRVTHVDGSTGLEGELAQSFVWMGGKVFVANRIDESFTVLDVEDSPKVQVYLENRPYGRTDGGGRILVNGLQPYYANLVSIKALDLAVDAQPERTSAVVAPRDGAGMVTRIKVRRERAALVVLRLPDGSPPLLGAQVGVVGSEETGLIGYDGEAYVKGLKPGQNRVEVSWPEGRCSAVVTTQAEVGRLDRLGPFTCAP